MESSSVISAMKGDKLKDSPMEKLVCKSEAICSPEEGVGPSKPTD